MNRDIKVINSKDDLYSCGVYKIYHINNPMRFYIGSVTSTQGRKGQTGFPRRLNAHLYMLRNKTHHAEGLQQIVNVYGLSGVRMDIMEICESNEAKGREQYYLDNLTPSLNTCVNSTNSTGFKHTDEAKRLMSLTRTGRKLSKETSHKISDRLKGKIPKNISILHSKESRLKVSAKLKGRKKDPSIYDTLRKEVLQLSVSGKLIHSYISIEEAIKATSIGRTSISLAASGKRLTGGGFKWQYALDHGLSISVHKV